MIPLLTAIHRWVGLALALVLLAVSTSGVLLLAKGPYHRWQYPSLARPITAADGAGTPEVLRRIDDRFGSAIRTVKMPQPGMNVFQVYLVDGSEAFVDSRDGSLIDRWRPSERVTAFLFDLHAHLISGHRGEVVNGVVAVLGVIFLALGGLIVWWPRRRVMRVRDWRPRSWAPGPLLRTHAGMGVITAVPLLLFLLTGAALALPEFVTPMLARAFDRKPATGVTARVPSSIGPRASWGAMLAAIEQALPASPEGSSERPRLVFLTPGRGDNAALTVRVRLPGEWHPNGRSVVVVNPSTAQVLQVIDARRQGAGTRLAHAIYPLHAARIGSGPSVLLVLVAVVAGLGLAVLCVTGVVTWWQRARARALSRARRQTAAGLSALDPGL